MRNSGNGARAVKGMTHLDAQGKARMVDVRSKPKTLRQATAIAEIQMDSVTAGMIQSRKIPKGNVFATARVAGIMAGKKVDSLIPLCHTLNLESIQIDFGFIKNRMIIRSMTSLEGKTGVEMEALTSASVAALTIYDMCKSVSKEMVIGPIYLAEKSGGRSGTYIRKGYGSKRLEEVLWQ